MLYLNVQVDDIFWLGYTGVIQSLATTEHHVASNSPQEIKNSLVLAR